MQKNQSQFGSPVEASAETTPSAEPKTAMENNGPSTLNDGSSLAEHEKRAPYLPMVSLCTKSCSGRPPSTSKINSPCTIPEHRVRRPTRLSFEIPFDEREDPKTTKPDEPKKKRGLSFLLN